MSLTITHNNSAASGTKKRAIAHVLHVGPLSLKFITLIIFAAMALFYLAQSTQSATNSYNIRARDLERDRLRNRYHDLEVESLRLKSLNNLKESSKDLGLEPITGN